jgi:hypothetical protein
MNDQTDDLMEKIPVATLRVIAKKYSVKKWYQMKRIPLISILKDIPAAKKELVEAVLLFKKKGLGKNFYC